MRFADRREAGRVLSHLLVPHARRSDALVLGLPRGGVPVAYEVARALVLPLDVFVVRKLGAPGREELAMGAIATGHVKILNQEVIELLGIPSWRVDEAIAREEEELLRRERLYRGDRHPPSVAGKVAIVVDDGLATGSSMLAAVTALGQLSPARVIVAVPVAPPETVARLEEQADEVLSALTPETFFAVGAWYEDFTQTRDEEVRALLEQAANELAQAETRPWEP